MNRFDNFFGVGAFEHHDLSHNFFAFAVGRDGTETWSMPVAHFRNIFDFNGNSVPDRNHRIADIVQIFHQSFAANEIGLVIFFDVCPAGIAVVFFKGFKYFRNTYTHGFQLGRIDGHFVLLQKSAPGVDFHHARYARQIPLDNPVLNGAQIRGGITVFVAGFHIQDVLINFSQSGGNRPHFGRSEALRNFFFNRIEFFGNQLTRQVGAHTFFENDGYHRQSEFGHRTYLFHARQVGHFQFDGIGDKLFDVLRGQIFGNGDHLHLVVGNIRHRTDGNVG